MQPTDRTVLRVRTRGSVYHLGLLQRGERAAWIAIVRGTSKRVEGAVESQSHDPRIGNRSLWDVPLQAWIGKRLIIGSLISAPIEGVTRELNDERAALVASKLDELTPSRPLPAPVDGAPAWAPIGPAEGAPPASVVVGP